MCGSLYVEHVGAMMGDYLAHIRRDGSEEQTVAEYLRRVGDLMAEFAAGQASGFRQQCA